MRISASIYSSNAAEIDAFSRKHRDALVVIAAGNDGFVAAYETVGAPATAKNALAVGFSDRCANASWQAYQFVDANEAAGCGTASAAGCCTRGACSVASCCQYSITRCCPESYSSASASGENVAGGSSRGFTKDARIKPDLVAPGTHIVSARARAKTSTSAPDSTPHCTRPSAYQTDGALVTKSGSSMAAAAVASAALVVRQYFADGWYPSGWRSAGAGFEASGALVKALLLAAAIPPRGTYEFDSRNIQLGNTPNEAAGFGTPLLSHVLRVKPPGSLPPPATPSPARPFTLWVKDEASIITSGTVHQYLISNVFQAVTVANMRDVSIVLVWTDEPGVAGVQGSSSVLVNDLDLNITLASNNLTLPSRGQFRTNDANGGTHPVPRRDNTNNVEKVVVTGKWAALNGVTTSDAISVQVSGMCMSMCRRLLFACLCVFVCMHICSSLRLFLLRVHGGERRGADIRAGDNGS